MIFGFIYVFYMVLWYFGIWHDFEGKCWVYWVHACFSGILVYACLRHA